MSRDKELFKKIGILATGDEVSQGDILNSNSQEIASKLISEGMQVRLHVVTPDNISEIENSLRFLLSHHQAVIITGGLGPTSDDLTRFALSNVLNEELIFDNETWHAIELRLKKLGYPSPPESNKQQALFPKSAKIIRNANGTAAGCYVDRKDSLIFMLPGPPSECLPMVTEICIPKLIEKNFQQAQYRNKWLLFGVSEGKIAEELDEIAKPFDCVTGYRLCYPYIEFKLYSSNQQDFTVLSSLIEKAIHPYLLADGKTPASELLQEELFKTRTSISIQDNATGGALESKIKTPFTYPYVRFTQDSSFKNLKVTVKGLNHFWENCDSTKTNLEIKFENCPKAQELKEEIPLRGKRVIQYAVEFISYQIYKKLKMQ